MVEGNHIVVAKSFPTLINELNTITRYIRLQIISNNTFQKLFLVVNPSCYHTATSLIIIMLYPAHTKFSPLDADSICLVEYLEQV